MPAPASLNASLAKIIGLSNTDCPCSQEGKPVDYAPGLSGYNITDQKDGIPVKFLGAIADCEGGGLWDILEQSRVEGVKKFITDLNTAFGLTYAPIIPNFKGFIGKVDNATAITSTKRRAVLRVRGCHMPAVLKFSGLHMYSSVTGSTDFQIYNWRDLADPIFEGEVDTVAGKWTYTKMDAPELIDLYDLAFEESEVYYLTWELQEGDYARKNRVGCCLQNEAKNRWRSYVTFSAFMVDDLSQMETTAAQPWNEVGLGAALEVEIGCHFGGFLTDMSFDMFSDTGFPWQVAVTLKHASVLCAADAFIKTQNINHYTIHSREVVYGIRAHAEKEYVAGMGYIVQNMPVEALQCYKCRDERLAVRSIMV